MNSILNSRVSRIFTLPKFSLKQIAIFDRCKPYLRGLVAFLLVLFIIFGVFLINQGLRLRITSTGLQWQISAKNNILSPNKELINTLQGNYNQLVTDKASLAATLVIQNDKLAETTKNLEAKNQEYNKLNDENTKAKADIEAKAKELEQKNKDLESKAGEVNGLNNAKDNLQNQKTTLESQKATLERQKKDLEKTIASGNFSQARIPTKPTLPSPQTKVFTPPGPNNSSRTVTVIYFWFATSEGYGALCSGELNSAKTVITTVTHCQNNAPKNPDRVMYRNIPVNSPDIFAVYTQSFNINFGDNNYKIISVDKGIVNASYDTRTNGHCYTGSNTCNEILVKTSTTLGEGNSGSTVYDPSGRFVGVLSGGFEESRCPLIAVGNLPPQGGNRSCSTSIIIALDGGYSVFARS